MKWIQSINLQNYIIYIIQFLSMFPSSEHFKPNTSSIQSTPHDSEVTSQKGRVAVPASCLFVGHPHAWGHRCHKHYAPADPAKTKIEFNVCQSSGSNQVWLNQHDVINMNKHFHDIHCHANKNNYPKLISDVHLWCFNTSLLGFFPPSKESNESLCRQPSNGRAQC